MANLQNTINQDGVIWYRFSQKKGSLLGREIAYKNIFKDKLSSKIKAFSFIINNIRYVNWTHYISKDEVDLIVEDFSKKLKQAKNLRILPQQSDNSLKRAFQEVKAIKLNNQMSNRDLLRCFDYFQKQNGLMEGYLVSSNFVVRTLSWMLEEKLQKLFPKKTEAEIKGMIMDLAYNKKESVFLRRQLDLLRLAIKRKQGNLTQRSARIFIRKYGWLGMIFLIYKPFTHTDLTAELDGMDNPEQELKKIKDTKLKSIQRRDNLFQKISQYRELAHLIDLLTESSSVETEVLKNFQKFQYAFYPLLNFIAQRLNLTYNQLIYLTSDELTGCLKGAAKPPDKNVLKKRDSQGYAIYLTGGRLEVKFKVNLNKRTFGKSLRGMSACQGKITGRAKIVFDINELDKIKAGDILITGMTTPNFVVAMKKAGAIVTNDGGVTCHAAIVARELNKPCIIGTKIATEVFKDNDLLEVDATKGIIKILKK